MMMAPTLSLRTFLPSALALLMLLGCSTDRPPSRPERLFTQVLESVMMNDPLLLHRLVMADTVTGMDPHELVRHMPPDVGTWKDQAEKLTEKVQQWRRKNPNSADLAVLEHYLLAVRNRAPLDRYVYPVTEHSGPHADLPRLFSRMKVNSRRQVEDYLRSLDEVEHRLGLVIDDLEQRRKQGIVAPSFQLRKVRQQCDSIVRLPMGQNPFYWPFAQALNRIGLMEPGIRSAHLTDCSQRILGSVIPAYVRLSRYLAQLEETSMEIAGLWQYDQGDRLYRKALYWYCGTSVDPDSLYPIAKQELLRTQRRWHDLRPSPQEQQTTRPPDVLPFPASMPRFRHFVPCDAHTKGLALYVHLHETSFRMAALNEDRLAAMQLMLDLGIHHKRWLRDQAIRFVNDHADLDPISVERLVDDCIAHPGKMAAAKVGHLTILALEEALREHPADNVDVNEFIRKLKEDGPLPLDVLRTRVCRP